MAKKRLNKSVLAARKAHIAYDKQFKQQDTYVVSIQTPVEPAIVEDAKQVDDGS